MIARTEPSLTVISSFAELADVVAERNSKAAESEGQRSKFSVPTAPSFLTFFCINSIMILLSALTSRKIGDVSNHTTVGVNFKIRDGGVWKPASAHTVEYSDSSESEKVVTNWVRGKWRLFNTEPGGTHCLLAIQHRNINR